MHRQSVAYITGQADIEHTKAARSKIAHLGKVGARLPRMRVAY